MDANMAASMAVESGHAIKVALTNMYDYGSKSLWLLWFSRFSHL